MKFIKKNWLLILCIIIQTILYFFVGTHKEYLHIDEAYSYGLSNYDKINIQDNQDFFNDWHNKKYYENYLSIQDEESWNFKPVYENQKNDVHPPLYYFFLRLAMEITKGQFSKWSGIILNILIYIFITIFMYLILKRLFKDEKNEKIKSTILAFISSITLASISNAIYIRMYALLTLEILITIFLNIKLLEKNNISKKILFAIFISTLSGILTHYYYLFFIPIIYLIFIIKYIKEKNIKMGIYYTLTIFTAGIFSIIIFPYIIQHMFFGYRGQGVISNFQNIKEIGLYIWNHIYNLNYYGFNGILFFIFLIIFLILIYKKIFKKEKLKINKEKINILKIILLPSSFFFLMSAISSPWRVLRYIVPVCALLFVSIIYFLYKLIESISNEKISNIIIACIFILMLVTPQIFNLQPELLYKDYKPIVQQLEGELNLPTIYFYKSGMSFLDDILLFSKINNSYILNNEKYTETEIKNIFNGKNIKNGVIVFTKDDEDKDEVINCVERALHFSSCDYLKKLTACDVYYIHNN